MYVSSHQNCSNADTLHLRDGFKYLIGCAVSLGLALAGQAALAQTDAHALILQADGFKNENGHAIAKLFLPGDNVRKKGREEVSAKILAGRTTLVFSALPPGQYAVVVFHDANDNGVIDHRLLGLPSEALGFSNSFVPSIAAGLPSFEKLQFTHGAHPQTLFIHME
jgi:uncharacterized protein (DUF2141 family)